MGERFDRRDSEESTLAPLNFWDIIWRVFLGTVVFSAIVWMAGHFPPAAGLMLTFPALNGLAFIFSPYKAISEITRTMLWMPLVNGILCVIYLIAFLVLATPEYATTLAWCLAGMIALLWLAMVTRTLVRCGVAPTLQTRYAIGVAGIALILTWLYFTRFVANASIAEGATRPALTWLKVILFAFVMVLLIVLPRRFNWGARVSGILSGLPLVVLAGLLSIAQDSTTDLEVRRALFMQMMLGIWLAPPMAVAFILGVSRVLTNTCVDGGRIRRVKVVGLGWALCFLAIIVTGMVLQWLATA